MGQPVRLNNSQNSQQRRKRKRRRRLLRLLFPISLVILVIVAVVLLASFMVQRLLGDGSSSSAPPPASSQAETTAPPPPSTTAGTTAPPSSSTAAPGGSTAIDTAFFNDTAFIGDSRTEGLMLYTGLENATFYAHKGLNVSTYFTSKIIKSGYSKITIPEALGKQSFKKVYIMLGINELGWAYESVFIQQYGELVDNVKSLQPDATIYVQAILPVTKEKSDSDAIFNNPKIDRYNELLQQMAQEKGVRYLAVNEAVGLDDGALPASASADGIHFDKEYCYRWLDYLTKHG